MINNLVPEKKNTTFFDEKEPRKLSPKFKVKVGTVNPKHLKKTLTKEYDYCLLGISLGNAKMEDEKLDACVRWISENFSKCTLIIGDSIYRHTLKATQNITNQNTRTLALEKGKDFKDKYQFILDKYKKNCSFEWKCTSEIEQHHNFSEYLKIYTNLYNHNPKFKELVNFSSEKYLSGICTLETLPERERLEKISLTVNYFIEESALFTCLCDEQMNVLIYPGTIKPLEIISNGQIEGVPNSIKELIQVRVNLNHKGMFIPRLKKLSNLGEIPPIYTYKLFKQLQGKTLDIFLSYTEKRNYYAGDIIAFKGMCNRDLYIITNGVIEVLAGDMESNELEHIAYSGSTSMINDAIFFNGHPRSTHIAALTDCETLFLSSSSFEKMLRLHPKIAAILLQDMAGVMAEQIINPKINLT